MSHKRISSRHWLVAWEGIIWSADCGRVLTSGSSLGFQDAGPVGSEPDGSRMLTKRDSEQEARHENQSHFQIQQRLAFIQRMGAKDGHHSSSYSSTCT